MTNPLLDLSSLTRFDEIKPEHITPAVAELIRRAEETVRSVESMQEPPTWENFVAVLDDGLEGLFKAWGVVNHLTSVADTPELRAAYNENLMPVVGFQTALAQNESLYKKYRALKDSSSFASLSDAKKRAIENTILDFVLGGAELPDDKKAEYAQIQTQLAQLSQKFSENLLDATNAYTLDVADEKDLNGLPEYALAAAKAAAEAAGVSGYRFTLHYPSMLPVLQYAANRSLRKQMYTANATKASELSFEGKHDNAPVMAEILKLRKRCAELLGYRNYAGVSLAQKMAEDDSEVMAFLVNLSERSKPFAVKDYEEVKRFADVKLSIKDLKAWDLSFASEKLRESRYAFSDEEVRAYFPAPTVLDGLFSLFGSLYGVKVLPDTAPVWHPDVKFFKLERDGKTVGQFYLDLYARHGKRAGAWMDDARSLRTKNGVRITPIAYVTCNFTPPVARDGEMQPSYLSHGEVETLFHEFGHCLHHLLTEVDVPGVSGISGVEWDAVELPSQFMENFAWSYDVLKPMTKHRDTGEPLPEALFERMKAAKNFQSGLMMARQLEFSIVDMALHSTFDPNGKQTPKELLDDVRKAHAVVIPPDFNRFLCSFAHIFAGGYAAGYYSYKWAEVLSADIFGSFEDAATKGEPLVNSRLGAKLVAEILSRGGSRPAMESFVAYMGRKPEIDALLRHNGFAA